MMSRMRGRRTRFAVYRGLQASRSLAHCALYAASCPTASSGDATPASAASESCSLSVTATLPLMSLGAASTSLEEPTDPP
jgi:hypothetical protein